MNVKTLINKVKKVCEGKVTLRDIEVSFSLDMENNNETINVLVFYNGENGPDNFSSTIYSTIEDNFNIEYILKQVELKVLEKTKPTSIKSFNL